MDEDAQVGTGHTREPCETAANRADSEENANALRIVETSTSPAAQPLADNSADAAHPDADDEDRTTAPSNIPQRRSKVYKPGAALTARYVMYLMGHHSD